MSRPLLANLLKQFLVLGILMGTAACSLSAQTAVTPTISVTQAYETVEARLTRAVAMTPRPTRTPEGGGTPTLAPSPTPAPSETLAPPTPTVTITPLCDLAAAGFPIDVTIPDDTVMQPGQSFTKTWRLRNVGTCTWTRQYSAVWFSGEMLSAPSAVAMPRPVAAGESVEISVDMTAPGSRGTYQSNWKLRNAAGLLFGIGPNGESPFWVRIQVVETPTETALPLPQPSLTPTATATPDVHIMGQVSLSPGDQLDLDSLKLNTGLEEDVLYQLNASNNALLTPLNGATLGVFGASAPSLQNCRAASLSSASLPVESLTAGTYLCALSNQGRYGWLRLNSLDTQTFLLDTDALLWVSAPP